MIDWTDPNTIGAILGSSVGLFGGIIGVWGACIGAFAPKGLHRGPLMFTGYMFAVLGVAISITGLVMLLNDAILALWLPLLLAGVNISILMLILTRVAKNRYAQAEERLMSAESLRRE